MVKEIARDDNSKEPKMTSSDVIKETVGKKKSSHELSKILAGYNDKRNIIYQRQLMQQEEKDVKNIKQKSIDILQDKDKDKGVNIREERLWDSCRKFYHLRLVKPLRIPHGDTRGVPFVGLGHRGIVPIVDICKVYCFVR